MLSEDLVYLGTKAFLKAHGWTLLAGQPPNGCNSLPVVEIKCPERKGIGSLGAYKPDLIAARDGIFLLVECKPDHSVRDAIKLADILASGERVNLLYAEICQRKLLERKGIECNAMRFSAGIRGALAHSGSPQRQEHLLSIIINTPEGEGYYVLPSAHDHMLSCLKNA